MIDEIDVVVATLANDGRPPGRLGISHWSARFLAAGLGISFASVARIWRKWDILPHRVETFKFSTDPELESKIRDVVGLYREPPANAVVVSVDEKSQIQAYPGSILGVCDGGPEADMTDFRSVADGLSGVRSQGRSTSATDAPQLLTWRDLPRCARLRRPRCLPALSSLLL